MALDMIPSDATPAFLAAHGWAGAVVEPLAGDASFRRYFRVRQNMRSAVLMDAPPPHEDPRPFVAMAAWLRDRGFAAPAVLAIDLERGLVLLEDFGDARMRETVEAVPARTSELYGRAVDMLVALHGHPAAMLRPYDRAELQREAMLFVEWYCPAVGLSVDVDDYRAAWDEAFAHIAETGSVTVLRDYHVENLMLLDDGARLGLLDFQDALAGHPAYDLVSLLQDARRDVDGATEAAMLARYTDATGAGAAFLSAYHVLGAQRNAKILGIFTRLWKRDGKPRYTALCPRVWRYLARDLARPELAPVARWFDANVPADRRGDPIAVAVA